MFFQLCNFHVQLLFDGSSFFCSFRIHISEIFTFISFIRIDSSLTDYSYRYANSLTLTVPSYCFSKINQNLKLKKESNILPDEFTARV